MLVDAGHEGLGISAVIKFGEMMSECAIL